MCDLKIRLGLTSSPTNKNYMARWEEDGRAAHTENLQDAPLKIKSHLIFKDRQILTTV